MEEAAGSSPVARSARKEERKEERAMEIAQLITIEEAAQRLGIQPGLINAPTSGIVEV
jgi:predicted transcriptional regulator of viral defense system